MMMVDEFSIFDDEVEETGQEQEVEAYCAKCKADTLHVVVSRYDDEIRKARCSSCDDIHGFRPPRGEEDSSEPNTRKKPQKAKLSWEQVVGKNKKEVRPYNVNEIFNDMDVISHPIFGKGFVSEQIGYDKIEVTFEIDKRILVHNRQRRPLPLPEYTKPEETNRTKESRSAELAGNEDQDFDDLIDLGEDLLLGSSTKLSPKAWAALHEEDEEEAPEFAQHADDDYDDIDDSDEDDDKPNASAKKKKMKASKETNKKASAKQKPNRLPPEGKAKVSSSKKALERTPKKKKAAR